MKLRKVVKKIVALGTGATMLLGTLGATMAAADLANYPVPFIDNGTFSGVLVIGDKAAAEDVIGVSDIAVSLQFAATKTVSTTTSAATVIEGDVFKIKASGDNLNIMEPLSSVKNVLDSGSLKALASGTVSNDKGTYTYNQYLTLGNTTVQFSTAGDGAESIDVDDPKLYLKIKQDGGSANAADGSEAFLYKLTFPTALKSDIDSSRDLDDLDNKKITMLGKEYSIIDTSFTTAGKLTIDLMGGALQDTMEEGETKTYTISGVDYEVTVSTITDTAPYKVKFVINGETTDALEATQTYTLADKSQIGIKEILPNEAGDVTADVVEFYLGANKIRLQDSNSSSNNAGSLTIASNDITDGVGDLVWTNTTTDLSLSTIQIAWQSDDAYYIPIGDKLSEHVTGDQDVVDLLAALNIDFEFAGMEPSTTDEITIIPSGSNNLKLTTTLKGGDKLSMDMWYYNSSGIPKIILGKDATRLIRTCEATSTGASNCVLEGVDYLVIGNSSMVFDEQYFVVETNKYSHVLQLKKIDTSASTVTLKDVASGTTDTISYSAGTATFYKDGYDYTLAVGGSEINLTKIAGDSTDRGFAAQAAPGTAASNDNIADLWTEHGAKIRLFNNATIILEEPVNGHESSPEDHNMLDVDHINITLDISSSKTRVGSVTASSPIYNDPNGGADPTITLDSDSDKAQGYTSWGTYIEYSKPTGGQYKVELTYPEEEAVANVYVTAGVTKKVEGSAEGVESVTIQRIEVGATKLASEIADVKAQNAILVGGPCANAAAATVMGNPADCTAGFEAGKGLIKLYEHANGNVALLVAGYAALDTRTAAQVVANYKDYTLKGTNMEVTTATSTVKEVTEVEETTTEETEEEA